MVLTGGASGTALAASNIGPMGRQWNYTYFTNQDINPTNLTWVFLPFGQTQYDGLGPNCGTNNCVMNEASFIKVYHDRLFDSTSMANEGRAAAEIDIMLGEPGATFGGSIATGIAYAQAHFAQWESLINVYASGTVPGYNVNWNVTNLYYTSDAMGASYPQNNSTCAGYGGFVCSGDVAYVQTYNDSNVDRGVVFTANGQQFIIKDKCANIEGTVNSLPNPTSSITITKTSSHPTPITVGGSMDYDLQVAEAQNVPLTKVTISDTLPSEFSYVGPANGSPAPSVNGSTLTWTFSGAADSSILSSIANGTETLSFAVKATVIGTAVNTATGTATDQSGANVPVNPGSTTNNVQATTTPAVDALNGDVQAGGGACGQAQTNGSVTGHVGSGAYATYVVSASGSISDFASNSGLGNLTLGATGGYNTVCQVDLYKAAVSNYGEVPSMALPANTAATPYDISGWSGVYYIHGNAYLYASKPITNKMTIVDEGGNVFITSDLALTSNVVAADKVPSVGIIAQNDIDIDAAVTRVDAYMFADGLIDTCEPGSGSCSGSTLQINGFVMADNIIYSRLGPLNATGSPVAESIALNPQIYLNPPTFFDSQNVDIPQLLGEGERPPLF